MDLFFYILFLFAIPKISSQVIPQIIEHIEPAVISDKGTVYLNCTMAILRKDFEKARWYSEDDNKLISTGGNVELNIKDVHGNQKYIVKFISQRPSYVPIMPDQSQEVWNYQLTIRTFIYTYSKNYRCELDLADYPKDQKPHAIGKVVLLKAPFISPIATKIINENESLSLLCEANGSPSPNISWTKANGQPFPLKNSPQRIRGNNLFIKSVGRYDRGLYRCHAQNNVGKAAEYDVMVEVQFPPTVRHARREGYYSQMPNQNYELMIECIINGYPDPDLEWYKGIYDPKKNLHPIMNDERYSSEKIMSYGAVGTNITDVFFVLRILNVIDLDYGYYTCLASNNKGSDQKQIYVFKQNICQGALCFLSTSGAKVIKMTQYSIVIAALICLISHLHL